MTAPPPDWTGAACLGVRGFHDTAPDSIERALALCNGTDTIVTGTLAYINSTAFRHGYGELAQVLLANLPDEVPSV